MFFVYTPIAGGSGWAIMTSDRGASTVWGKGERERERERDREESKVQVLCGATAPHGGGARPW